MKFTYRVMLLFAILLILFTFFLTKAFVVKEVNSQIVETMESTGSTSDGRTAEEIKADNEWIDNIVKTVPEPTFRE